MRQIRESCGFAERLPVVKKGVNQRKEVSRYITIQVVLKPKTNDAYQREKCDAGTGSSSDTARSWYKNKPWPLQTSFEGVYLGRDGSLFVRSHSLTAAHFLFDAIQR